MISKAVFGSISLVVIYLVLQLIFLSSGKPIHSLILSSIGITCIIIYNLILKSKSVSRSVTNSRSLQVDTPQYDDLRTAIYVVEKKILQTTDPTTLETLNERRGLLLRKQQLLDKMD